MRVLLLSANRLSEPYPVYPIGLDYVRGALEPRHQVAVLDLAVERHRESLAERVRDLDPELVGLALRNLDNTEAADARSFVDDYRALVARLRRLTAAPIVLGGPAFSIAPVALLAKLDADFGIVGEGERLADLADALATLADASATRHPLATANALDGIPGLVRPGKPVTPTTPLGSPPHRALAPPGPHLAHYLHRSGMLNLQTQRGCPFRCVYCTYPVVEGRHVRRFDPRAVARVARTLQDRGARFLFVTDAVLNADEEHGLAVAHALRQAGLSIPWGAYFSPRTTDRAYWQALADAGLTHVEFGTDSLDADVLGQYRKPFACAAVSAAHAAALAAGLHIAHFFVLGGPGESAATAGRTFAAAAALERCVCFFFVGMRIYPGTPLALRQDGATALPADGLTPTFYEPPGWSLAELQALAADEIARHPNWLEGSGGPRLAQSLSRLYALGHTGPLWERLIR